MFKGMGLFCVVLAASWTGFGFARAVRRQAAQLRQLVTALEFMKSEIQYRMTPLPELFGQLAGSPDPAVGGLFGLCAGFLRHDRTCPPAAAFQKALGEERRLVLSGETRQTLLALGLALGRFDVEGQCRSIELAERRLQKESDELEAKKRARCRSYETLGICAGLAIAVILV
jgi:stage III sporulation protein AB